jgi:hypothetical protein
MFFHWNRGKIQMIPAGFILIFILINY